MSRTFKTPKGTELPFLNLKGKDYLQVQHRIIWFREERPDWAIETSFLRLDDQVAISQATIKNDSGRVVAQGTKMETPQSFKDGYVEKAESGSIGRALAFIGYGTQFAQELEEGEVPQIVDSPLPEFNRPVSSLPKPSLAAVSNADPGSYIVNCAPFKGSRLDAIDIYQLNNWVQKWEGKQVTGVLADVLKHAEIFLKSRETKQVK